MARKTWLPKLKIGEWVRINWEDAKVYDPGWVDKNKLDEKHDIAACITVGIVVKRDRKQVILAMSAGKNDEEVGTTMAIPLGWITEVEVWPKGDKTDGRV